MKIKETKKKIHILIWIFNGFQKNYNLDEDKTMK